MSTFLLNGMLGKSIVMFVLIFTTLSGKAIAGLDSYEIYLNDKLLLKQSVDKPIPLESLQLNDANQNDRIVIYYSQCNAPGKLGKGRSIIIKDSRGNVVKAWKFDDAKDARGAMVIPVKDFLQLEKNYLVSSLSMYYNAEGTSEARKLTTLQVNTKNTTYTQARKPE